MTEDVSRADVKEAVRERYAGAARLASSQASGCCGPAATDDLAGAGFGAALYEEAARDEVPDAARLASLGCGNPTAVAELNEGETVLDLGSGGGLDVLLSARRVGPSGKVYGLDMTDEMLELARRNQAEAGIENVEFLKGEIEDVPLPDNSVDVIISNCVINLSADKSLVFEEAHRVLRPGGRFAVTDVVTTREFSPEEKADLAKWTGCIAGALTRDEYAGGLEAAGFSEVEVLTSHDVGDDVISAIIRATA
ncbi:MAG: Arsenite methyltransferase [Acidimicrobiales bacterium]|nr:MAG: methyltransferase domain-containing protein [Actinomycetota bacterium]MBV6508092.1 Arsenite methyltransferase [Acidimicrobiales bacterium]RIK05284.1 MAG: arsenite S-adenosylmethyltransferase [Acidobacteriota bacterium]